MSLRLSPEPDSPRPAATSPAGDPIVERAARCLAAGDFDAYPALFDDAARVEPAYRRYRLQRDLLEAGLHVSGPVPAPRLAALYLSLARAGVTMLEAEPREPVIANLTGVALYELGGLDGAEALFAAAHRMDPALPHVERNLAEIDRRRRAGTRVPLPKAVEVTLPALVERAKKCGAAARPVEGLTLSLCMIVKDEEEMLPRCLAAVREAVDEIVVVDTGSADRTVEIARSFGAKVIDFEWTGSFSDARNVSFDAATGDWVMYLDADEVLVAEDAARLRALTGKVWREAFYLVETNFTGELEDGTAVTHNALRVFRNRPEYRFEGRLHEQIGHTLPGAARVEMTDVRIEHYGYLGVVRDAKEKSRRNIELLKRQHEEDGVEDSNRVFFHFNLGSEYGAAGEPVPARDEFAKAWEILQASGNHRALGFVPSLIQRYVAALRITGDHAGAHARAEEGLELFPGFTDLVLEQASAARDCGDTARAIELYERCLEWGDAPSRYTATVGAGTYIALVALADVRRVRGELAEAERLLGRCLDEHPGYLGVVGPLAGVMLARGADADTVVEAIESRVREATPNVRFQLGIALYEAAQTVHAEAQFRGVLARQPDNRPARVALAEALLSQSRFEEAAAEAQLLRGDESPYATPALRAELFARLVVGDGEAAGEALAAAPAALHPAEHALFSAWHALAGGDPVPQSLPLEAVPLLATTLEALLRVQQFDAFGLLVGLLDRTGLPWRERRELLASTYLRRGYLESAADEWITVCQERGPDAPALIGLAQVAVARDLPADALLFAREATSMDPAHPGAARLLANLQAA